MKKITSNSVSFALHPLCTSPSRRYRSVMQDSRKIMVDCSSREKHLSWFLLRSIYDSEIFDPFILSECCSTELPPWSSVIFIWVWVGLGFGFLNTLHIHFPLGLEPGNNGLGCFSESFTIANKESK